MYTNVSMKPGQFYIFKENILIYMFAQKEDLAIRQKTLPTRGLSPHFSINIFFSFLINDIYTKKENYQKKKKGK